VVITIEGSHKRVRDRMKHMCEKVYIE